MRACMPTERRPDDCVRKESAAQAIVGGLEEGGNGGLEERFWRLRGVVGAIVFVFWCFLVGGDGMVVVRVVGSGVKCV